MVNRTPLKTHSVKLIINYLAVELNYTYFSIWHSLILKEAASTQKEAAAVKFPCRFIDHNLLLSHTRLEGVHLISTFVASCWHSLCWSESSMTEQLMTKPMTSKHCRQTCDKNWLSIIMVILSFPSIPAVLNKRWPPPRGAADSGLYIVIKQLHKMFIVARKHPQMTDDVALAWCCQFSAITTRRRNKQKKKGS